MAKKSKALKKGKAKPASPAGRKIAVKKKAVKKAAPKKVVTKKSAAKKTVKKAVPKKAPVKKPAVKKPVAKKIATKKIVTKKPTVKKASPVKAVAKKKAVIKVVTAKAVVTKKPSAVKTTKPTHMPEAASLPPTTELSEELVEKAANTNREQMMVPGDGLNDSPPVTESQVTGFDKNVFNKAMAKGDPHSNMQFSSKPKNAVKSSGKKPL